MRGSLRDNRFVAVTAATTLVATACAGGDGDSGDEAQGGDEIRINVSEPSGLLTDVAESEGSTTLQNTCTGLLEYEMPIGNGPFEVDGQWGHGRPIRLTMLENYAGDNMIHTNPDFTKLTVQ